MQTVIVRVWRLFPIRDTPSKQSYDHSCFNYIQYLHIYYCLLSGMLKEGQSNQNLTQFRLCNIFETSNKQEQCGSS